MSAADKRLGTVMIRNARIIFRNFSGLEGQYNAAGQRNFGVVLPPETAMAMAEDGWNIKYLKPREEGEDPTPWVPVSVSYKGRPPRIALISTVTNHETGEPVQRRLELPESLVEMVDFVDIGNADLILNPYQWSVRGESGVKAYLKTLYITINQDELEQEYSAIEEIRPDGQPAAIEQMKAITDESDIIDGEVVEDDPFN